MALSYGSKGLPVFIAMIACVLVMAMSDGEARTIVVGGSEGWHLGINYTDWSIRNSPFYINDKLVFKYEPSDDPALGYSVYSLPDLGSFIACDFSKARLLANATQGSGDQGFELKLSQWRPYYLASYGHDANHCNDGLMKVLAVPWPRLT